MRLLILLCFSLLYFSGISQKSVIDFNAVDNWVSVGNKAQISDDGRYVLYSIDSASHFSLIVQSVDGNWKKELTEGQVYSSKFSKNGRFFFCNMNKSGLRILHTGKDEVEEIASVKVWKIVESGNREFLLALSGSSSSNKLLIWDLETGRRDEIDSVKQFYVATNGSKMLFTKEGMGGIYCCDLATIRITLLANVYKPSNFVFDQIGNQVAFIGVDTLLTKGKKSVKTIWYANLVSGRVQSLMSDSSSFLSQSSFIQGVTGFYGGDSSVAIDIREYLPVSASEDGKVDVCIWSYSDSKPQIFKSFSSLPSREESKIYRGMYLLSGRRFVRLESGDTVAAIQPGGKYWAISTVSSNWQDAYWNTYVTKSNLLGLVNAIDGSWVNLSRKNIGSFYTMNSAGNYMVFFDTVLKEYCGYSIVSGKVVNFTKAIRQKSRSRANKITDFSGVEFQVVGWLKGGEQIVINFRNDLWLLDVTGVNVARNITKGYWEGDDINLRFLKEGEDEYLRLGERYSVAVFNKRTKLNEFYVISLSENSPPRLINSMDAVVYIPGAALQSGRDFEPVRAKNAAVFLVKGMTAKTSGNYFTTRDFKQFKQLSYVYPEKRYNWLSSELVNCKLPDNSVAQGILYKPENFDAGKKYPVIIHYYETKSDELHLFLTPERTGASFNIPWFVSRGYLVFCMDIHYEKGKPGASAYKYIDAGAEYLSHLPYVDKHKMGLFGHSFGGFETNYIVTHTTRFAAVVSSAGISNMASLHSGLWGSGESMMNFVTNSQTRMGTQPWEDSNLYTENSPIFLVNRVQTPVLLMHNIKDGNVPFVQGVSFFTALRRCGKKAWLLQYDKGGHILNDKNDETDFTNRVTDYFNYFLKDMLLPCWMSSSDAAQFKRNCDGYNNVNKLN